MEGFFICISSIKKELVEKVSGDDRNYRLEIIDEYIKVRLEYYNKRKILGDFMFNFIKNKLNS